MCLTSQIFPLVVGEAEAGSAQAVEVAHLGLFYYLREAKEGIKQPHFTDE